jgi:LuxR family maltose regulon positive regulatory protein
MLHLIITTRDLPPLAIMRRRSQSMAAIVSRDDLLFTDDEVRELFRTTLNLELKPEEIHEYRERTHGWITALQLVRQITEQQIHASTGASAPNLHEMLEQSEKDIFDYFAEEVFAREPEEVQICCCIYLCSTVCRSKFAVRCFRQCAARRFCRNWSSKTFF